MTDKKKIELSLEDIEKVSGGSEPPEGEDIHEGNESWDPINAKECRGNLSDAINKKKSGKSKK